MEFNIAVMSGDGIGPEIVEEAKKVLVTVGKKFGHTFNFNDCFSSYANFLDELVTNEKTQIILEQVIQKIEKGKNGAFLIIKMIFRI